MSNLTIEEKLKVIENYLSHRPTRAELDLRYCSEWEEGYSIGEATVADALRRILDQ